MKQSAVDALTSLTAHSLQAYSEEAPLKEGVNSNAAGGEEMCGNGRIMKHFSVGQPS